MKQKCFLQMQFRILTGLFYLDFPSFLEFFHVTVFLIPTFLLLNEVWLYLVTAYHFTNSHLGPFF